MQNFMNNFRPADAPNGGQVADDGVPWWMKYAGKGTGAVAGVVAIIFGVWACISFSPLCIVAGIWQVLAGVLLVAVEAPFCCMFLDFVQQFSNMVEQRPIWQKGALYLILSLPPLFLCFGTAQFIGSGAIFVAATLQGIMILGKNTIVGSGLIFATAVLYGMQVLGKKAPREVMAASASSSSFSSSKPENMKSNLVTNIHGQDVEAAKQGP